MEKISLFLQYTEIFKDWDFAKNDLALNSLYLRLRETVWWKCNNGHSYKVSIFSRIRSNGCKICNTKSKVLVAKKKLVNRRGSIFKIRPELENEWDYSKNKIKPNDLTIGSNEKVWWKCCLCSYEFEMVIKQRKKSKCPICTKKETAKDKRLEAVAKKGLSLFDEHPLLMEEWDLIKNKINPNEITSGSNYMAYWECKFGHKWIAKVYNRTGNESGCPDCKANTSKLEVFFLCELRHLFENVVWRNKFHGFECDIYIEDIDVGIEIDGGYWHSDKLESDTLKTKTFQNYNIELYRIREEKLPKIIGHTITYSSRDKKNDIFLNFLIVLKEKYLNKKINEYLKTKYQRGEKEYKKILSLLPTPAEGETLKIRYPELCIEWDYESNAPLKPEMFAWSSNAKVYWVCSKCNFKWEASINNRTGNKKSGCPSCYESIRGKKLRKSLLTIKGLSFADEFPEMIEEWDFELNEYTPKELLSNSNIKINFKCSKGHQYKKILQSVTDTLRKSNTRTPCPICYNDIMGENLTKHKIKKDGSLEKNHPELCKEWDYVKNKINPSEYHSGSDKKVFWQCSNNHSYEARINSRIAGIGQCPQCQSLSYIHPTLMKEWDFSKNNNFNPKTLRPNSKEVVWWKCEFGHSLEASIVTKAKSGICQTCASISHKFPKLMNQWDFSKNSMYDPKVLKPKSKQVVWWKCDFGHSSYKQMIASRTYEKKGCNECIIKKASRKSILK